MKINWKVLIVSFVIVFSVGFIGSLLVGEGVDSEWYESIKPEITPPDFVFPIVWNVLFFLIALSLYFAWVGSSGIDRKKIGVVFGVNFTLNILWSWFYFGLRNPGLAFIDLVLLEASIVGMIYFSYRIDRRAAWLLVPYLLWVGFAGVLNWLSI